MIKSFDGKYAFLSNFYPSPFTALGQAWPDVEHFFHAMKTMDPKLREKIRRMPDPGVAKRAGRNLQLREDWNEVKDTVMLTGVRMKFFQDSVLMDMLLKTGTSVLEEGNTWHDNYWGKCHCIRCKRYKKYNRLGSVLTLVRNEVRDLYGV